MAEVVAILRKLTTLSVEKFSPLTEFLQEADVAMSTIVDEFWIASA